MISPLKSSKNFRNIKCSFERNRPPPMMFMKSVSRLIGDSLLWVPRVHHKKVGTKEKVKKIPSTPIGGLWNLMMWSNLKPPFHCSILAYFINRFTYLLMHYKMTPPIVVSWSKNTPRFHIIFWLIMMLRGMGALYFLGYGFTIYWVTYYCIARDSSKTN